MSRVCVTLSFLVIYLVQFLDGYSSDNVLLPQFETRNMEPIAAPPYTSQYQINRYKPQQVLHSNMVQRRTPQASMLDAQGRHNLTPDEYLEFNEVQHREEMHQPRTAAATSRDENSAYPTLPRPVGYSGSSSYTPASSYHETPSVLAPSVAQPKMPLLKPDLSSLLAPVTTKVSTKLNGLIGLIFSLLSGSASGGMDMTGLKDVFINGIIRPLLIAKGGIKALIAKLSIPVISLLLINLEVLITVWWLWEECPAKIEPPPSVEPPHESKPTYTYNAYR